jgi:plastocyanin
VAITGKQDENAEDLWARSQQAKFCTILIMMELTGVAFFEMRELDRRPSLAKSTGETMMSTRNALIAGLATLVLVALGLLFADSPNVAANTPPPATTEVKIDNFSFTPATLTVAAGTTVTWTNRDDIPHTVVSVDDPKAFKSKVMDTDEKFSFTFTKAGTYTYFCSVHPKMTGTVVVK